MKERTKQLFKGFLFSLIISVAASCIYFAATQKDIDYSHVISPIMEGVFFLNIIVFIMSLPSLFLVNPLYWRNLPVRLLLYFSGPVIFIITTVCLKLQPSYKVVYLITGVVFLIVHSVFYYLTVKKRA
ncbi:hypothetical protein [Mucilaginibacter lappiensis]|jgi:hypothetical protein|uniref:hypothetical protein n=1 Tax=Mucilaginibacter lappiensis TaxID=354630 RepID=UPI003D20DF06